MTPLPEFAADPMSAALALAVCGAKPFKIPKVVQKLHDSLGGSPPASISVADLRKALGGDKSWNGFTNPFRNKLTDEQKSQYKELKLEQRQQLQWAIDPEAAITKVFNRATSYTDNSTIADEFWFTGDHLANPAHLNNKHCS